MEAKREEKMQKKGKERKEKTRGGRVSHHTGTHFPASSPAAKRTKISSKLSHYDIIPQEIL